MSSPSDFEQLTLEYVNLLRTDPGGEYDRLVGQQSNIASAINFFGVDLAALQAQLAALTAVAPLAWNNSLSTSAETHSQLMITEDRQAHNFPGELGLRDRIEAAGYTNWTTIGENIYAFSDDALHGHAGFVIDWGTDDVDRNPDGSLKPNWQTLGDGIQDPAGHRDSLMNGLRTEIGIGVIRETNGATSVGEYVTTQHLGNRSDYQAQFLGVVIRDADSDGFYDIGEGLGGVTVTLQSGGTTLSTTTWASGGWQIEAGPGTYQITFSGGGLGADVVTTATIGNENVKIDAIDPGAPAGNVAPLVTVEDQTIALSANPWATLSSVLQVSDANGDAMTLYEIWDSDGGNNWWADGAMRDASAGYQTADLSDIWFTRDTVASEQTLWVRAFDGTDWSVWDSFQLITEGGGNTPPVARVETQSVAQNAWRKLDAVIDATDGDGDALVLFQIWDDEGDASWWADNRVVDASAGYQTSDLSGIWFQGDDSAGSQTLWVRASDGTDWSAWDAFDLITV